MDVAEFIEGFAKSFQKFMMEAQLSSAVSMVIDEGVLSEVHIKPSVIQSGVMTLIQELQNLHDLCDPVRSEKIPDAPRCWNCKRDKRTNPSFDLDPTVIQITANNKEIDKRIRAFIERKQTEKDDTNRREFCSAVTQPSEASCARTDAVFSCKMGGKSHVKVSKVVNKYGPQTRPALISVPLTRPGVKRARTPPDSSSCSSLSVSGVEERLHNMESFLKMKSGQNSPSDIFQRLKGLEDRLLHLESVSPEYSHISSSMSKYQRGESGSKAPAGDTAVQDIDNRIKELQRSLRLRKAQMEMETTSLKKTDT